MTAHDGFPSAALQSSGPVVARTERAATVSRDREIAQKHEKSHNGRPRAPVTSTEDWPKTGFLRLSQIIGPNQPLPISNSTWWAGVKSGRFPQPVKLGPRTTAWRVEEIVALIAQFSGQQPERAELPEVAAAKASRNPI